MTRTPTAPRSVVADLPDDGRAVDEGRASRAGDRAPPARARAARPSRPASQRSRRREPGDRDRTPPSRGTAPARGGGGVESARRAGGLRGAPAARARSSRRCTAAACDARDRPAAAATARSRARHRSSDPHSTRRSTRSGGRSRTCARSQRASGRHGWTRASRRLSPTSRALRPIPVDLDATHERLPPQVEAAAYFVVCEAVTNAVKHASPSHVRVEATVVERSAEIGGRRRRHRRGNGGGRHRAQGLTDRVEAQGGTLLIHSPPGAGTRLEAEIPCGS